MVTIIRHNILPALALPSEGAGGSSGASGDQPVVSILVVSYNTRDMTMECLESVIDQTRDVPHEIIVVENASTDGSREAIAKLGSKVLLIALRDNIGFARANNLAAREARGDYLLLLNPDTLVLDGAIDRLALFANANPAAGIWGGRTLAGDRKLDPTSVWARMTLWSLICRALALDKIFANSTLFNAEGIGGWNRDTVRRVDIVTGCFLMIRRELWEALGGFDRAFFMYGEEADLCLRATKLGARPLFTPTATIVHYGGASEATQVGKVEKLFRAKITLMRRHWSIPCRAVGKGLLMGWALSRWLIAGALSLGGRNYTRTRQAVMWREVWRRRTNWLVGYDDAGAPAIKAVNTSRAMRPR